MMYEIAGFLKEHFKLNSLVIPSDRLHYHSILARLQSATNQNDLCEILLPKIFNES